MRRSAALLLATSLLAVVLLVAGGPARAAIGGLPLPTGVAPPVPGQLVDDGPLAPTPLCDTEPAAAPLPVPAGPLRVGTYNVLHTQDPDGNPTALQRVGMLADAIAESDADVLGLQEVAKSATLAEKAEAAGLDDGDAVTGLMVELIAQGLATSTGDDWSWCWFASNAHIPLEPEPTPGGGGGPLTELATLGSGQQTGNGDEFREGVAILSRYSISSVTVKRLSLRMHEALYCDEIDPIGCQFAVVFDSRVVMHGVIATPDGPVDLYTSHLAHGVTTESDATKARQIEEGLDHIVATEDQATPTFFVGDFNTEATGEPDAGRYQSVLAAGFIDTYAAAASVGAHDTSDPLGTSSQDVVGENSTVGHTIDYVFAKQLGDVTVTYGDIIGNQRATRQDTGGVGWVWPSDHLGVVVTFGQSLVG